MRTGRRLARTLAFQTLFELESRSGQALADTLRQRVDALEEEMGEALSAESAAFASRLVDAALARRSEIDSHIGRLAPAFPVDQMATTDRVALELALLELLYERDAPVKVVINEAVELAKTFGGQNSGRFVNGVLGTIAEELRRGDSGEATPILHTKRRATKHRGGRGSGSGFD